MSRRLTTAEFIEKSNKAHSNKYDYSKSIYVKNSDKIIVTCKIHGEFLIRAQGHMAGKGCLRCAVEKRSALKFLSNDTFIKRSKLVHGNQYDYSETFYKSARDKVKIICRNHGSFYQLPSEHMKGSGCKKCSLRKILPDEFINRASIIHNNKYLYSDTGYYNYASNIKVICPIHGEFIINARTHLRGQGCKICSRYDIGWRKSTYVNFCNEKHEGKSILYIIKINNKENEFFKIGISVHGYLKRYRFQKRNLSMEKIIEVQGSAKKIWEIEKILHRICRSKKIDFPSGLNSGDTECFTEINIGILRDRIINYFDGDLLWL